MARTSRPPTHRTEVIPPASPVPLDTLAPFGVRRRSVQRMTPAEMVPPALYYATQGEESAANMGVSTAHSPRETSVDRTGAGIDPDAVAEYYPDANKIVLDPAKGAIDDAEQRAYPHEVGHAIWGSTLPDFIKEQWNHIHKAQLTADTSERGALRGFVNYPDDPSHSFADVYAMFVGQPELLEWQRPALYNWFRAVIGREYKKRDAIEQQSPAAQVPFYWGSLK